jgi:hypothetical protein
MPQTNRPSGRILLAITHDPSTTGGALPVGDSPHVSQ